jgi:hypothetical protein
MQPWKVTVPWTIVAILVSLAVGVFLNHRIEARWVSPVGMALIMGALIGLGRIPPKRRRQLQQGLARLGRGVKR